MLRIIIRIIVALVLTVALVVTIGYALPRDHVASMTRLVNMPPQRVFTRITRVDQYPEWRKDIDRVDVLSTAPVRWREHSGGDTITFEIVQSVADQRVISRIADPELPFGGTWTYELRPDGSGTRVTITEHGEVYNPLFRFMSRFIFGHTATIEGYLDALANDGAR